MSVFGYMAAVVQWQHHKVDCAVPGIKQPFKTFVQWFGSP
jgi:hypothetical protein